MKEQNTKIALALVAGFFAYQIQKKDNSTQVGRIYTKEIKEQLADINIVRCFEGSFSKGPKKRQGVCQSHGGTIKSPADFKYTANPRARKLVQKINENEILKRRQIKKHTTEFKKGSWDDKQKNPLEEYPEIYNKFEKKKEKLILELSQERIF